MTIDNLISWLQEAEDNNTWLVSTQSVKRHLEKIKETEQLTLTDVSNCINEKLVDWLCEDYIREEAIDQIQNATIKEDRVFTVTYDNGKYDKVVLENNIIKTHKPR